jgi:hypothetical protein
MIVNKMNLRRKVSDGLVMRGFRRMGRMHLLRADKDWSYWVDTGPIGKQPDISPFVGIRHDDIERLFLELLHLPRDQIVGTLGANVGYILDGKYRFWSSADKFDEVLQAIEMALERLRPFMTLNTISEGWRIEGTQTPGWQYREIIVLLLNGEKQLMLDRLRAARTELCRYNDALCEEFIRFEQTVLTRC